MNTVILQARQLSIGYALPRQSKVVIAQRLNLQLRRGELVCLLGANGVGKSTLLRTLTGIQPPLEGHVSIGGSDVHQLSPRQIARKLSIVLTDRLNVGLLDGYALVALGRHPHTGWTGRLTRYDEAVIAWAIDAVGAGELAARQVMELSDGQRQKLMIARALAQETDLILLDEPTAYLDLPHRVEIMRLLRELARETGRGILLSTHDLDLALRTADTVWLMDESGIHNGAPEDLMIDGAFARAFERDGLHFDPDSGMFRMGAAHRGTIVLNGRGLAYTWTRRALEREGFDVLAAHNGRPPIAHIEIMDDTPPRWCLQVDETRHMVTSVQAVLAALQLSHRVVS
ncbi:MAG: ABC transporter ATP-binding protein [bacterium]|nr:ABC transporter ATP-binding protein [bacterium]